MGRNFAGNSLIIINDEEDDNNTSKDSVSDLDSDEDDEEDLDEGMNEKPLTAKEAKQLQREWLKSRYDTIRNGSDDEASRYENVKDQSSSDEADEVLIMKIVNMNLTVQI